MGFNRNTWTKDYSQAPGLRALAKQDAKSWVKKKETRAKERKEKARENV